jgi:uncharacterized protein (TIGR02145 family)
MLFLFPSCNDDSVAPKENQPPEIQSITSSPSTSPTNRLSGGDTVRVSVVVTDPDQDELSYTWQADAGQFDGDIDKPNVKWIAPIRDTEGDYVIKVIVSDGTLTAEGDITIYVDKTLAPSVITAEVTNITGTSATSGGNVTDDGGAEITARGVVWNTSQQPTLTSNDGYTTDGAGIGSFTSIITGLNSETQYYVRAYATNSQGTAYGDQVGFTTPTTTGTVTDIDGNIYQTIKMGNQWWMAENLRVSRYRNEDDIPTGLSDTDWQNTTSGAYAIYAHGDVDGINSDEEMVNAYGKLYNWYAVVDNRSLCPTGWRVPSDGDWTALVDYLVAQGYPNQRNNPNGAGNALKSRRQVNSPLGAPWATSEHPRWDSHSTHHGLDIFGFSGLPGGCHYYDGSYGTIGTYGYWWSSTEDYAGYAWFRNLGYLFGIVGRHDYFNPGGFSVRCLRDE